MSVWILGTTLLAAYFSTHYWGEHQRREGLVSSAEASQLAPPEWQHDVQAREFVQARELLPAELPPVAAGVAIGDLVEVGLPGQARVYRITAIEVVDPGEVRVATTLANQCARW